MLLRILEPSLAMGRTVKLSMRRRKIKSMELNQLRAVGHPAPRHNLSGPEISGAAPETQFFVLSCRYKIYARRPSSRQIFPLRHWSPKHADEEFNGSD